MKNIAVSIIRLEFKPRVLSVIMAVCILSSLSLHAQHTKLWDFNGTNGALPWGSLISDGTFLYGMTAEGGVNDDGVIFKILPNGTGYVKLFDFEATTSGNFTPGSLIYDGTFLYGMANSGGANNLGTIFKILPDGSGFQKLHDFTNTNGARPEGSLFSDGTFLYGMTSGGGTNNFGTIFKIMPDGTGFTKMLDFNGSANGATPFGSLISDGTFLYGMTSAGGSSNIGTIFKILKDGTGYVKLLNFNGGTTGREPYGSLLYDGTFLYGMTLRGGSVNDGVIFKIRPDGTGYLKLNDFNNSGQKTESPYGDLVTDGTFLYGLTYFGGVGGTNDYGTLFKILPDGTGFTRLHDFTTNTDGWLPYGSPLLVGSFLYGTTQQGGTSGPGTIFGYALPAPPAPTIIGFTPASGPVGTTVTITGTNFSIIAANNTVTFNGVTAVVTSSSATSIIVTVPAGATTGPIAVTVSGVTATSATDFIVTTVSNEPPVIASSTTSVWIEGSVTINLLDLISDPDDNLDLSTLSLVTSTSEQGASASINSASELVLDYDGVPFVGTDRITIQVCDFLGACTQQELIIEVGGDIVVYNAVSPHEDDLNDKFFIEYIDIVPDTQKNKVTIFNRWGDLVFETTDYNNDDRVFTGLNQKGEKLPSGTYYYKIEFSGGRKTKTGYLSLKQ